MRLLPIHPNYTPITPPLHINLFYCTHNFNNTVLVAERRAALVKSRSRSNVFSSVYGDVTQEIHFGGETVKKAQLTEAEVLLNKLRELWSPTHTHTHTHPLTHAYVLQERITNTHRIQEIHIHLFIVYNKQKPSCE